MTDKRITSNQRYNAERKAQAELMKRDLDRDKVLAQIYQESFDRMQREIDGFYMRYARKEGLTKQEVMKRVSEIDVRKFNAKAAKVVREKDFSPGTNAWLRISIHAPAKGATLCGCLGCLWWPISIHAPAKGATMWPNIER